MCVRRWYWLWLLWAEGVGGAQFFLTPGKVKRWWGKAREVLLVLLWCGALSFGGLGGGRLWWVMGGTLMSGYFFSDGGDRQVGLINVSKYN